MFVFDKIAARIHLKKFFIGETITDLDKLINSHVQGLKNFIDGLTQIGPRELPVMASNEFDPILPGYASTTNMQTGNVGRATEANFRNLK